MLYNYRRYLVYTSGIKKENYWCRIHVYKRKNNSHSSNSMVETVK